MSTTAKSKTKTRAKVSAKTKKLKPKPKPKKKPTITSTDDVYVLRSGLKWVVRRKSKVRATAVVDTKAQAVRIAKATARESGSQVIIGK